MSAADYVRFERGAGNALYALLPIAGIEGTLVISRDRKGWRPVAVDLPGAGRQPLNPFAPAIAADVTAGLSVLADEWEAQTRKAAA